jgi:hypothetical protein
MGYIIASGGSGGSGGGGSFEPATAGELTITSGETLTDFTRPAGALKLRVINAGPGGGGTADTATVNGASLFPGNELIFEARLDPVTNVFKYLPEMTIVTNGAEIWYYEER